MKNYLLMLLTLGSSCYAEPLLYNMVNFESGQTMFNVNIVSASNDEVIAELSDSFSQGKLIVPSKTLLKIKCNGNQINSGKPIGQIINFNGQPVKNADIVLLTENNQQVYCNTSTARATKIKAMSNTSFKINNLEIPKYFASLNFSVTGYDYGIYAVMQNQFQTKIIIAVGKQPAVYIRDGKELKMINQKISTDFHGFITYIIDGSGYKTLSLVDSENNIEDITISN